MYTFTANHAVIMIWIHDQPNWPNFTWTDATLAPKLAEVRHRQGRLLGRMEGIGFELKREATLKTLTDDVVHSAAIEGAVLDPEDVRSSLARRLGIDVAGVPTIKRDVEGIVEVMLDATQHHAQPLTAERLFAWHAALFPTGHSAMTRITVAAWRPESAGPMQVISGPYGKMKVHFEAPHAFRLDDEMEAFLNWFENGDGIDPVLKAGIAHLWFVTIHPFEDGNGRIGRAILDMMLARGDNSSDRYYSLSSQIEAERRDYYDHLERQQRGELNITPWLDWFLDCLSRAITPAETNYSTVVFKARLWEWINHESVNERQRNVINRMLNGFKGHMSTSKYAKLVKCSTDTALRDIRELVERGILVQNPGGGRSTSYRIITIDELPNRGQP